LLQCLLIAVPAVRFLPATIPGISVRLYIPRFVTVTIPCTLARIPGIKMTIPRISARIPGISGRRCPDHGFCQRHRHCAGSSFSPKNLLKSISAYSVYTPLQSTVFKWLTLGHKIRIRSGTRRTRSLWRVHPGTLMSPPTAGHEHRPRHTSVWLQSDQVSKVEEKRRAVVVAREAALRHTDNYSILMSHFYPAR